MISTISILVALLDYISTANLIFIKLEDNIDLFEKEFYLIDEIKCHLINYKDLDEFEYDGAYIYESNNKYHIRYEDLNIELEVNDGRIYDYGYEWGGNIIVRKLSEQIKEVEDSFEDANFLESIDKVFAKTNKQERVSNARILVSMKIKKETLEYYKSFGTGYTSKMSRILEYAPSDEELLKKCGIVY